MVRVPGEYKCEHCGTQGSSALFTVGVDGCPERPESLNYLMVCPGGDGCQGHMDKTTEAWHQWKASSSMPSDLVPRYQCGETERGNRAAAQFLRYAERVGLTVKNWTTVNTSADGALVGTFQHGQNSYELWVGRTGEITPLRVGSVA